MNSNPYTPKGSKIRMATYNGELPERPKSVWLPGQPEDQILKALAETEWGQRESRRREASIWREQQTWADDPDWDE